MNIDLMVKEAQEKVNIFINEIAAQASEEIKADFDKLKKETETRLDVLEKELVHR